MEIVEIVTIILISLFFISLLFSFIYKKIKHIPTSGCEYCKNKTNNLLKEYRKKYQNK